MTDLLVKDLTVTYERGEHVIRPLDGLSFEGRSGELILVLGPSGSGKTTLLSVLAGILRPTAGRVRAGGVDVEALEGPALAEYRRRTVGVVFQAFNLIPSLTARENVEVPLRLNGLDKGAARARAEDLLEQVGLADRARHKPAAMSGGQQQRVAIARGLALDPPLVIMDEPTAHLDYVQVEGLLRLIRGLAAPGRLVLVATHDARLTPLADRVVDLAPRAVIEAGEIRTLTLQAGEVLFHEGAPADLVYVVDAGEIEIVRAAAKGERPVARVKKGEYFGELGPLLGFPRSATARARKETTVTGYPLHEFRRLAANQPAVASVLGRAGRTQEGTR